MSGYSSRAGGGGHAKLCRWTGLTQLVGKWRTSREGKVSGKGPKGHGRNLTSPRVFWRTSERLNEAHPFILLL